MNDPERRFRIQRAAPRPVRLSDFGLSRDDDGADVEFRTMFTAHVTVAEFKAMYGPDENIVYYMIHDAVIADGWTITVGSEEVLCCETGYPMQQVLIDAMLLDAGQSSLRYPELQERARDYSDITPDAVQFLLEMFDKAEDPTLVDTEKELARARDQGLTLSDFLRHA